MKLLTITTLCATLFFMVGCSHDNAFDRFALSQKQKLAENSIQSSKISLDKTVDGVVYVVYLNEVMPKKYHGDEYFYIYLYSKDKNPKFSFLLNSKPPVEVEKLASFNRFTQLTSHNVKWNKYFLVRFKKQNKRVLSLKVKNKQYNSDLFTYVKDQ
jgi:hypothetical protein